MVSVISEWVRCPICGNKTRLQIPAGEAQGGRDKPGRGVLPAFASSCAYSTPDRMIPITFMPNTSLTYCVLPPPPHSVP